MKLLCSLVLSATAIFAGDLTARFALTLNRISHGTSPQFTRDFILADAVPQNTRRFTNFSGDVSGRYIGAMALAAEHSGTADPELAAVVKGVLRVQQPDGHFGGPFTTNKVQNSDMAILWGNGRLLIGLLEYYGFDPRPDVLAAAKKLGDFLVKIGPLMNSDAVRNEFNGEKFAVGYICWTQNLEGLVELYRLTHDDRYLALSKEIAARTDRHPSQHSHGYLTTLRGMVELYRVTGDRSYLTRVESEWRGVDKSGNVLIQGGVPEMFAPQIKRDEGCSEADWLRLGLDLWRETRDLQYIQQAEFAFFNEFSFNQFRSGDFGHHVLTASGVSGPSTRAWWCCTFHGLRAMAALFGSVFHEKDGVVYYDLPVDGKTAAGAGGLAVRAESSLEQNATVRLNITAADSTRRTLAIRNPDWVRELTIFVNGERFLWPLRNGYLEIARVWKSGDVVAVEYALKTRVLTPEKQPQIAVVHGPWLLAVDEATSLHYFDEPSIQNQVQLPATEAPRTARAATPFEVPVAHLQVKYLPGGYSVQPGTALLRPIAEFTQGPDFNHLDFWLPVKPQIEKLDSTYKP